MRRKLARSPSTTALLLALQDVEPSEHWYTSMYW